MDDPTLLVPGGVIGKPEQWVIVFLTYKAPGYNVEIPTIHIDGVVGIFKNEGEASKFATKNFPTANYGIIEVTPSIVTSH